MQRNKKFVYLFGGESAEGHADMKDLLGGKGANLAEMCLIGLPVPAGFTITTDCCTRFFRNRMRFPTGLEQEVLSALAKVEKTMGMKFNDATNPLLVSCRSGARRSMRLRRVFQDLQAVLVRERGDARHVGHLTEQMDRYDALGLRGHALRVPA